MSLSLVNSENSECKLKKKNPEYQYQYQVHPFTVYEIKIIHNRINIPNIQKEVLTEDK